MNKFIYVIYSNDELAKLGLTIDQEVFSILLDPYSKIVELSDVKNKTVSLDNAKAMMDCTSNHIFYNNAISRKNGSEIKTATGRNYIKTLKGNFLMKGVPLLDIMLASNSRKSVPSKLSNDDYSFELEKESIKKMDESMEKLIKEHHIILNELGSHIPYIVNSKRYEKAITTSGIEIEVESFRDVRYKLVSDDDCVVDKNVEKITPSDIKILKELHSMLVNLK